MPFHLLVFIPRKDGVSTADFISNYENKYVPLVSKVVKEAGKEDLNPTVYSRKFTHRDENGITGTHGILGFGVELEFDAVIESKFEAREKALEWDGLVRSDERVKALEDEFWNKAGVKAVVVEEKEGGL